MLELEHKNLNIEDPDEKVLKEAIISVKNDIMTPQARMLMRWIESFDLTQVLLWVSNCGMIYFVMCVGVSRWVNVLLSAVGEVLLTFDLAVVIVLYLLLGISMFLLPPVPGVPV